MSRTSRVVQSLLVESHERLEVGDISVNLDSNVHVVVVIFTVAKVFLEVSCFSEISQTQDGDESSSNHVWNVGLVNGSTIIQLELEVFSVFLRVHGGHTVLSHSPVVEKSN